MVANSFDRNTEAWCSYDYHWSIVARGRNIFIMPAWERSGGVNDSGYVWCDEVQWSADTPESPVSILPLLTYCHWSDREPMDLRGAQVSVYLRGDGLELHGAQCYFWVLGALGRWHFSSHPLDITAGEWSTIPNVFTLASDEELWNHSWSPDPSTPTALRDALTRVYSYGFSFVGFGQEPRGRFCMDEFAIRPATTGRP